MPRTKLECLQCFIYPLQIIYFFCRPLCTLIFIVKICKKMSFSIIMIFLNYQLFPLNLNHMVISKNMYLVASIKLQFIVCLSRLELSKWATNKYQLLLFFSVGAVWFSFSAYLIPCWPYATINNISNVAFLKWRYYISSVFQLPIYAIVDKTIVIIHEYDEWTFIECFKCSSIQVLNFETMACFSQWATHVKFIYV